LLGAICLALAGLLIAASVPAQSAEYTVFNSTATDQFVHRAALKSMNDKVGCELWGKPVERDGRPALRFRFPALGSESDADFVDCIRRAMPPGYSIEKASWFKSKLHEWLP
jgi:hypothetical protein